MTEYKKLELLQFAKNPVRDTAETRYWKQFKNPVTKREFDKVTSIHFSPEAPYELAVTASTRVQIYNSETCELDKSISRFKNTAYSGTFRSDGKLLVAGGEDALVQVFEVATKGVLRAFKGHKAPVHVAKFLADKVSVVSCADDKTIRRWDIPTESEAAVLTGHSDYIRCGAAHPSQASFWTSGSYDHSIRCWDLRTNECVLTMSHGAPVEAVIALSGGGLLASAGENTIKIWDIVGGGRLIHEFANHQKTVTALCLDSSSSRLVSASLDQMVKFYDVTTFQVTHSMKYDSPILSMGISENNRTLAVGMLNGDVCIRKRDNKRDREDLQQSSHRVIRTGSYRYFMRGQYKPPSDEDLKMEAFKKQKLQDYDKYLRKFQYREALNAAIKSRHPVVVASLFEELMQLGGLKIALSNRDETQLVPVLKFVMRYLANPHFSSTLVDVSNTLIDLYGPVLGQSLVVDEMFERLRQEVLREGQFQKKLLALMGSVDMLLGSASTGSVSTFEDDIRLADEENIDEEVTTSNELS